MCGIFGFQINNHKIIKNLTIDFLKLSEERGREASGICLNHDNIFDILKSPSGGSSLCKQKAFNTLFHNRENHSTNNLIGQCRLATDGKSYIDKYNHPAVYQDLCLVHNGIILNSDHLLSEIDSENKENYSQSDTFNFVKIISLLKNNENSYYDVFQDLQRKITGSYSIAFFDNKKNSMFITSNNKSLYYYKTEEAFIFASEKITINKIINKYSLIDKNALIHQIKPFDFLEIHDNLLLKNTNKDNSVLDKSRDTFFNIIGADKIKKIVRCKSCILPYTYPYIFFDKKGVCNFCNDYVRVNTHKKDKLKIYLDKYRKNDGSPDCLVGLSGGRDSCYGLHVLKNEYGMNPVAYTYDWGLTTKISRRNQALLVGKLGIEHVIRSPKIDLKRENIRKNVHAWLSKPELGMVPLFMAGDKDFYKYGRELRKNYDLDLTIFCSGQHYEQGNFFIGFCGIKEDLSNVSRAYSYPFNAKFKLAAYYIYQYLRNPRYINRSFYDSIKSFVEMFLFKDNFLYLYEYIDWDEKQIEKTLKDVYNWEPDKGFGENQWRMGDGQTAFTNYIYYKIAGFTEFDDFRSKQIRDKKISRDEALKLVEIDNLPKYEVLEFFANTIGINLEHVLSRINAIEKIY